MTLQYPAFAPRGRLLQPVVLESLVVQRPAPLPSGWATQISGSSLTQEDERTFWSVGGSAARLLPSLAASNTLERYARASFSALEGSLLSSSPAQTLTWQQAPNPGVSGVRYSRETFWAILRKIGRWVGINLLEGENGRFDPELWVKEAGRQIYSERVTNERGHGSLIDVLTSFSSVLFHRAGYHRLPAKVARSLRSRRNSGPDGRTEAPLEIQDALGLEEWQTKELSGLFGLFPVVVEFQKDGDVQKLQADTLADLLGELLGLAVNNYVQGEFNTTVSKMSLFESTHARLAALQARDFAAANSDFLGYKSNPIERELELDYSPEATSMTDFLQASKYKWKGVSYEEKVDIIEYLSAINAATELVKAAISRPVKNAEDLVKTIRELKEADDQSWERAKQRYRNPTAEDLPSHPDATTFDRDLIDLGPNQ